MANANNKKLIKIYGVTLANKECRTRAYGHGSEKIEIDSGEIFVDYVDYFIDDLVVLIKNQELEKQFIAKLSEK